MMPARLLKRVKSGGTASTFFLAPSFWYTPINAARRSSSLMTVVGEPWAKKVGIRFPAAESAEAAAWRERPAGKQLGAPRALCPLRILSIPLAGRVHPGIPEADSM